jgi:hypothetical protein
MSNHIPKLTQKDYPFGLLCFLLNEKLISNGNGQKERLLTR